MRTVKKIYVSLIFLFLYAPIGTLIVLSFNASKTRAKWGGFTLKWYASLLKNQHLIGVDFKGEHISMNKMQEMRNLKFADGSQLNQPIGKLYLHTV